MVTHGLAAAIRAAQESGTFDLGGQTYSAIESTITSAFSEPLPFVSAAADADANGGTQPGMIRLSFITGAGKSGRSRYNEGASRAVSSALRSCGYKEDRASSCVPECAGTYKLQHDTGKNLKTVVVFPRLVEDPAEWTQGRDSGAEEEAEPLIPRDSPGHKIATVSMGVFRNMLVSRCPSWSQKKGCLDCIEALRQIMSDIDEKLIGAVALEGPEKAFYDSAVDLEEKESHLKSEMSRHVEGGTVTKHEKEMLLNHNAERIAALKGEGNSASKALQRKGLLENIDPTPPHRLRHEAEIGKRYKELGPLLELEAIARGRLLTVAETQALGRKNELEEEIERLEEASRGWFEDDDTFEARVMACRDVFEKRRKRKAAKRASGASSGAGDGKGRSGHVNKWVLPGEASKGKRSKYRPKKKKVVGGSLFAAMMESDSSEDDSDDEEEDDNISELLNAEDDIDSDDLPHQEDTLYVEKAASPKTKKKKKKKKKKNSKQQDLSSDTVIAASREIEGSGTVEVQKEKESDNDSLQMQILKFLLAFLYWSLTAIVGGLYKLFLMILSSISGGNMKKKKKKKKSQ